MTVKQTDQSPLPRAAQPFNRRLRAHGHTLTPSGTMHAEDSRHLARQERIGLLVAFVVFFATVYGVTRDFVQPLVVIGGAAAFVLLVPLMLRRTRSRRRRHGPTR